MNQAPTKKDSGFTLVEMIVSITLLSLLALVAVPMLRMPMKAYSEASSRAALAGEINMARGRMADDLSRALPNSVRVRTVGTAWLLEYLEVRAHGRYRTGQNTASGPSCPVAPGCGGAPNMRDALNTSCNDNCFTSLGPMVSMGQGAGNPVANSDYVVVNRTDVDAYVGGAATVAGGSKSRLTGFAAVSASEQRFSFTAHRFVPVGTTEPASRRFYVVSTPVTYECNPVTRQLRRYSNYPVSATQPTAFPAGTQVAQLASTVQSCGAAPRYITAAGINNAGGVVQFSILFADAPSGNAANQLEQVEMVFSQAVSEGVL